MLDGLFDTSEFVTRGQCGPGWTWTLVWVYVIANGLIAVAYFAIPMGLLVLWRRRRKDIHHPHMLLLFAAFILACAASRMVGVVEFWWAPYRFYAIIHLTTALLSVSTAVALPASVRYLVSLPTPDELEHQKRGRAMVRQSLDSIQASLVVRAKSLKERLDVIDYQISRLASDTTNHLWRDDVMVSIGKLREDINLISEAGKS